ADRARRAPGGGRGRSGDRRDRTRSWNACRMITQVKAEDWNRLREARLRALADAPDAFLESIEHASTFAESHWRTRATPRPTQASFLREDGGAMVSCFIADDPATVFLVGMWVSPELRGTGVAGQLVERV